MKSLYVSAIFALFSVAAGAQDGPFAAQVKMMGIQGAVMGKTVKGAPYSGTEINETNQVLADGTRIHNETQTQVWRDSEGRVRRESGNFITIYDPVANASYSLNTKSQTAHKLPLGTYMLTSDADGTRTNVQYFRFSTSGGALPELKTPPTPPAHTEVRRIEQGTPEVDSMILMKAKRIPAKPAITESLGRRMMEGVNADGSRETSTIEPGTIGNDRPIQMVSERWFSQDLQTLMMSRHSDPRTGEETFKLINVSRTEPPAYLFQIPAGYQIQ